MRARFVGLPNPTQERKTTFIATHTHTLILKKTFKVKPAGFKIGNEKSFSFHGSVTQEMVTLINSKLDRLQVVEGANRLRFSMDKSGHYFAGMNHNFQKYHEGGAVVAILDTMDEMGWGFRFQYASEMQSTKMTGDSYTMRELFIFNNRPLR